MTKSIDSSMKVLHLPLEVAGQVAEICDSLNANGYEAVGCNWRKINYLGYNKLLQTDAFELANSLDFALKYFDVFHYHTGYTIYKDKSDIVMALNEGKKVVMHHRGNDVRIPSQAVHGKYGHNPYVYTGDSQPEKEIISNLKFFSKHLSTAIVQDVELYDYVVDYYEQVYILPRLINTKSIHPTYAAKHADLPLVIHAPTSRKFKGTERIIEIVTELQKKLKFHFVLIEQMSKHEALEYYKKADIIIDQICCGTYGNVSVEAMALGKPVICYIRPDVLDRLPGKLPVVSAHPDNLAEQLMKLLQDGEYRYAQGVAGREYVMKYHDSQRVVQQLIRIYQSL